MFNLEDELGKWRMGMVAAGLNPPELIRELEEHLREDIIRQVRVGTSESDAFQRACERLGHPGALKNEFDIAAPKSVWGSLRRHMSKVLLCSAAGLIAALVFNMVRPAPYISEAKLLIRSIMREPTSSGLSSAITKSIPDQKMLDQMGIIVNRERAILTSWALAEQVAARLGADKILRRAGGGHELDRATALIKRGLTVDVRPQSSVVRIAFKHPDSTILQPVVREVIEQYLRMHVEAARRGGNQPIEVGKVSNISLIAAPSLPFSNFVASYGPSAAIVLTGILTGFAWVFALAGHSHLSARNRREIG